MLNKNFQFNHGHLGIECLTIERLHYLVNIHRSRKLTHFSQFEYRAKKVTCSEIPSPEGPTTSRLL